MTGTAAEAGEDGILNPPITIVPRPQTVTPTTQFFRLAASSRITIEQTPDSQDPDNGCVVTAGLLRDRLRPATGFTFDLIDSATDAQRDDRITLAIDATLGGSAYLISVADSGVHLTGGDGAGLFHATQTFLQLCPVDIFRRTPVAGVDWIVPGVEISDAPRFAWRGMLLDVCRHFFGRGSILTLIDALALHRLNVLHLHLTDDQGWRLEILRHPRLSAVGSWRAKSALVDTAELGEGETAVYNEVPHSGFLSQDDVREIVAYAAARFITVMPEIDIPGHSQAAIAAYPELGNTGEQLAVWTDWGISEHVLNLEPATVQFYRDVFDEVLALFPSEFIHIGGDECPTAEWEASDTAQARMRQLGLRRETDLQTWLTNHFAGYLAERGRRLVGWDEILQGTLPPGATVMSWQGVEAGIEAAEAGHDVIMAPEEKTYLLHRQSDDPRIEPRGSEPPVTLRDVYSFDPVPAGLSDEAAAHVLGAQCSMWTEFVGSEREMHQMVFPRLCAFAESVWRTEAAPVEEFLDRLEPQLQRLHGLGIDAWRAPPRLPTDGAHPGFGGTPG